MKKGNIFGIGLIAVILAGSLIALQSFGTSASPECKSVDKPCCKKKTGKTSDGMIWESLPHQFTLS